MSYDSIQTSLSKIEVSIARLEENQIALKEAVNLRIVESERDIQEIRADAKTQANRQWVHSAVIVPLTGTLMTIARHFRILP